jgi:hypothetical protein
VTRITAVKGEVAASADAAWQMVSDFGRLDRWNPAVVEIAAEGSGEGMVRTFRTSAGTIVERLLHLGSYELRYEIVSGSSLPVRNGCITIAIEPIGNDHCIVTWSLDGELTDDTPEALVKQIAARYEKRIEDLRAALRR